MTQDTEQRASFRKALSKLNEGQRKAVETIEGPVMVMAGPGTGKTQILTLRIAHILGQTDVPPDAILALTFTNAGVKAMRERLKTFIGHDAYRVNIFTFHGFASHVIESHPASFPRIIGASAADEVDQYEIVRAAIEEAGVPELRPPGDPEYYVKPIISLIGTLKGDAVDPEGYDAYLKTLVGDEAAFDEEGEPSTKMVRSSGFVLVYRAYERMMRERGLYDYSDMLVELIHALKNDSELRLELAESAQYILADEHQDANRAQNAILELLATAHPDGDQMPNLFIVGDDKQAIYRFQGASLENFLFFKERFPKGVLIPLTENYRSTKAILKAAGTLMVGRTIATVELTTPHDVGEPLEVVLGETAEDELQSVVARIKELIEHGVPTEEIAILLRKNRDIDLVVRMLRSAKVPFVSYRDSDALATSEVALLFALMRSVVDPHNSDALAKALFLPSFGLSTTVLSRLFSKHSRTRVPLFELLKEEPETARAVTFYTAMHKHAHTKSANATLDDIVTESGYIDEVLQGVSLPQVLDAYRSVRTLIETRSGRAHSYTLKDTLSLIRDLERGIVSLPLRGRGGQHGVQVMTLHKSKGLEFEHVFLPHALESRFKPRGTRSLFLVPPFVNQPDPDVEDERRLFYVGITRAKKCVYVSLHAHRDDEKEEHPVAFLTEVGDTKDTTAPRSENMRPDTQHTKTTRTQEYRELVLGFLESGISATALNAYLKDPWECFFKNILRLPETKAAHQMYGTAIHAALEYLYRESAEGHQPTTEAVCAEFTRALSREPLIHHEKDVFLAKGIAALTGYLEEYGQHINKNALTEVSVAADLTLPPECGRTSVHVRGFLDRIEVEEDGVTTHVFDYKTGKVKSRNEILGKTLASDGSIFRQVVFYKLLLDLEGKRVMADATIDFVEPNPRGKYKREPFTVSDEEKAELVGQIGMMVRDLEEGTFLQKTCTSDDVQVRGLSEIIRARYC